METVGLRGSYGGQVEKVSGLTPSAASGLLPYLDCLWLSLCLS